MCRGWCAYVFTLPGERVGQPWEMCVVKERGAEVDGSHGKLERDSERKVETDLWRKI